MCPSEYRINCILRIRTVRHFAGQLWPSGCMSVSAAPEQMCLPKSMGNYTMYAGTRIPPAEPHRLACGFSQYDCSKSILDLLSDTDNKWANSWRQKCIEKSKKPSLANLPIGTMIRVRIGSEEVLATKHAPAYQFRRPFWRTDTGYIKKNQIEKWEVVNP